MAGLNERDVALRAGDVKGLGVVSTLREHLGKRIVIRKAFGGDPDYPYDPVDYSTSMVFGSHVALGASSETTDGGVIAASLPGGEGTWSNAAVEDSLGNILNLVLVKTAYSGEPLFDYDGRPIFGLFQAASTVNDGDALDSENFQISLFKFAADGTKVQTTVINDDYYSKIVFAPSLLFSERHLHVIHRSNPDALWAMPWARPRIQLFQDFKILGTIPQGTRIDLAENRSHLAGGGNDQYTTLLIHSDESDGSTTFTDSSPSAHTVTAHSGVTHETDQHKFGSSSIYFAGSTYLGIDNDSDLDFGSDDFTIDWWEYRTNSDDKRSVFSNCTSRNNSGVLAGYCDSGARIDCYFSTDGSSWATYGTLNDTVPLNEWHHYAVVRSGNNIYLFTDGVLKDTLSISGSVFFDASDDSSIGRSNFGYLVGYIDEFRISKGIARWTSNFTPPAQPYGSKDTNTLLLIHSDDPHNSDVFIDSSENNRIVTGHGGIEHVSNYRSLGCTSCIRFDGAGDYLEIPASDDWNFGADDFTAEFWIRPNTVSGYHAIMTYSQHSGNKRSLIIYQHDDKIEVYWSSDGLSWSNQVGTVSLTVNEWAHIALSREGSSGRVFVNGVLDFTFTCPTLYSIDRPLQFGGYVDQDTEWFSGYMNEIRVSNTARYTSAFTPQTAPFNTSDAQAYNSADVFSNIVPADQGRWAREPGNEFCFMAWFDKWGFPQEGDASGRVRSVSGTGNMPEASTDQWKFGQVSVRANGNGLKRYTNNLESIDFSAASKKYSIDLWCRFDSMSGTQLLVGYLNDWDAEYQWSVGLDGSEFGFFYVRQDGTERTCTTTSLPSANAWHHVAVVCDGTNITLYIDGSQAAQVAAEQLHEPFSGSYLCVAGADATNHYYFTGYFDEIRVSSDKVRWTGAFTPPSQPMVWAPVDLSDDSYGLRYDGLSKVFLNGEELTKNEGTDIIRISSTRLKLPYALDAGDVLRVETYIDKR